MFGGRGFGTPPVAQALCVPVASKVGASKAPLLLMATRTACCCQGAPRPLGVWGATEPLLRQFTHPTWTATPHDYDTQWQQWFAVLAM